jgi:hypothetical protein
MTSSSEEKNEHHDVTNSALLSPLAFSSPIALQQYV